jgi:hypothetical protein
MRLAALLLVVLATVVRATAAATAKPLREPLPCGLAIVEDSKVVLNNGFVWASFDLTAPQLDVLKGDFAGTGAYGPNVLAAGTDPNGLNRRGIVLEVEALSSESGPATTVTTASSAGAGPDLRVTVLSNLTAVVSVRIDGIVDSVSSPTVTSSWTLTLMGASRALAISTVATVVASSSGRVLSGRYASYWAPASLYSQFSRGLLQMMNSPLPWFAASVDPATTGRLYALSGGGGPSIDVLFDGDRADDTAQIVFLNAPASNTFFRSGFLQVRTLPRACLPQLHGRSSLPLSRPPPACR